MKFTPIDLPKMPYSEDYYKKTYDEYASPGNLYWSRIVLRNNKYLKGLDLPEGAFKYWPDNSWYWNPVAISVFPELINFIEQAFPFSKLCMITLNRNIVEVPPHYDHRRSPARHPAVLKHGTVGEKIIQQYEEYLKELDNNYAEAEPALYRIFLTSERFGSFYIEDTDGSKLFPIMPSDTDVFAFNASKFRHGAEYPVGDKLLLVLHAWNDINKHKILLEKSIKKYKDFIIE